MTHTLIILPIHELEIPINAQIALRVKGESSRYAQRDRDVQYSTVTCA
jgi:hypothetical protein